MPNDPPVSIPDLIAFVQRFADDSQLQVERIILVQRSGLEIPLDIPCNRTPSASALPKRKYSKTMLRTVYAAVPADSPVTFQAIKNKCGYRDKSAIYACLRRLKEMGRIEEIAHKYRRTP